MALNPEDLKIDTYTAQGYGWNPPNSYVQVVHTPSKVGVVIGTERSQHANRHKAIQLLEALLLAMANDEGSTSDKEVSHGWPLPTPLVADKVMMIKEVRSRAGCGLKEAKEAVDLTGSIDGAMMHLTGSTGYCIEGEGCVCGGDLPAIREGCYNWKR